MGTTVSGIRVPTTGDVFDVPGDMLKTVTDLVAANTAQAAVYAKYTRGLQVQALGDVVFTNASGDISISYPVPFTVKPDVVLFGIADYTSYGPLFIVYNWASATTTAAAARVYRPTGVALGNSGAIRVNGIAVGTAT